MNGSNNQWVEATVEHIAEETPTVKTYSLALPKPALYAAGQHYELRLTAANGYQAARPYSAASTSTDMPLLNLTIQHVPDGEVSSYIFNSLEIGDKIEVRGPFGKFFTWNDTVADPILLIAGGSGVVPMRSILASHEALESKTEIQLLYSARTFDDILYKEFFLHSPAVTITLTENNPAEWQGYTGRIDVSLLKETLHKFSSPPTCYICGMSPFVTAMADGLQTLGIAPENIKTERFG